LVQEVVVLVQRAQVQALWDQLKQVMVQECQRLPLLLLQQLLIELAFVRRNCKA
jgi:hypothetical protein